MTRLNMSQNIFTGLRVFYVKVCIFVYMYFIETKIHLNRP